MERDATARVRREHFLPKPGNGSGFVLALAILLLTAPAAAQTMMFDDNFEEGHTGYWSQTLPETLQWCNCYFSSDCNSGNFCNWGPGGPSTEDICEWTTPKPSGSPGVGCDALHQGPWGGTICDGFCEPSTVGSIFGYEERTLVIEGLELWRDAILKPAEAGGGLVDLELSGQALALPFAMREAPMLLGRHVADLLIMTSSRGFYDHFCHFEQGHPDPSLAVDLSGDSCRLESGRLIVDAVIAELRSSGTGADVVAAIPAHCENWERAFAPRCRGLGAIDCLADRARGMAELLSTPRDLDFDRLLNQ